MNQLEEFKFYLRKRGIGEDHLKATVSQVRKFLINVKPLTRRNAELYLLDKKRNGLKPNSLNDYVVALRHLGRFLGTKKFNELPFFKREPVLKSTMSDEEIERFLSVPREHHQPEWTHRNHTMFYKVLALTGMRPGEVANLKRDDIDLGREVFIVRQAKTPAGVRMVPIPQNIRDDVVGHLQQRTEHFIQSSRGTKMNRVVWFRSFHRRLKWVGIDRPHLTVYSLRHSLITSLIEEDVSLFKIRQLVGHNSIKSTEAYVHLATKSIAEALERHPLIRKQTDPHRIIDMVSELINRFKFDQDDRFDYEVKQSNGKLSFSLKII